MKVLRFINLAIGLMFLCPLGAFAFDRITLGSLRQEYVGHSIMILPNSDPYGWVKVKEKKGRYEYAIFGTTGTALAGVNGQVVAVEEYDGLGDPRGTDDDSQMVDGFRVVVRLPNGQLVACTTSISGMKVDPYFADLEVLKKHTDLANSFAKSLGDKNLYLTSRSFVYDSGLTLDQAVAVVHGTKFNNASMTDFPRLQPVRLVNYEYITKLDLLELKLILPGGSSAIVVSEFDSYQNRWTANLLSSIPSAYTSEEIAAIQKGSFFVGMSEQALWDSLGLPETINDYGKGGQQWVYGGGKYVYLSGTKNNMKVVDVQTLN